MASRRPTTLIALDAQRVRVQLLMRAVTADQVVEDLDGIAPEMQVRSALRGRLVAWDVASAVLAAIHAHPADVGLPELVADVLPAVGA
jgi:hypothetical protein